MQLSYRLMTFACAMAMATGTAWAQQRVETPTAPGQSDVRVQQQGHKDKHVNLHQAGLFKASDLIGLDVRGAGGEELGEIEDFTIDAKTGKIRYAAVSMGGFLGIGDKLVAVPWDSFQLQMSGQGDDAELVASLNIDKNRMQTAQGFDQNNWPASADRMWQTGTERETETDVDVDVERTPERPIENR